MAPEMISFQTALEETKGLDRNLLLGNGFSIACPGGGFSYKELYEQANFDPDIQKYFEDDDGINFERAIENAASEKDKQRIIKGLFDAIYSVLLKVVYEISNETLKSCVAFLDNFQNVFTLNYDILLSWAILKSGRFKDGFGSRKKIKYGAYELKGRSEKSNVFYLHGAIHLFSGNQREIVKIVRRTEGKAGEHLLKEIDGMMTKSRELPVFVAEGSSKDKQKAIRSIDYLKNCHNSLSSMKGNLFIFGHSANKNDKHIYDIILPNTKIKKIYFFVHEPDSCVPGQGTNLAQIEENLKGLNKDFPQNSIGPVKRELTELIQYINTDSAEVWKDDGNQKLKTTSEKKPKSKTTKPKIEPAPSFSLEGGQQPDDSEEFKPWNSETQGSKLIESLTDPPTRG